MDYISIYCANRTKEKFNRLKSTFRLVKYVFPSLYPTTYPFLNLGFAELYGIRLGGPRTKKWGPLKPKGSVDLIFLPNKCHSVTHVNITRVT